MPRGRGRGRGRGKSQKSCSSTNETVSAERVSRSSRRSRVPKRYLDTEYSPASRKKRVRTRSPSISQGEECEMSLNKPSKHPTSSTSQNVSSARTDSNRSTPTVVSRPRGRPKSAKNKKMKEKNPWEEVEDECYVDYDSDESSEEDFDATTEVGVDEMEEILDLTDIKPEIKEELIEFCPWADIDPDNLPKLELPTSSCDIPLPNNVIFDAVEIYEIIRSYHRTLRLTPFTFENFCGALISTNNSTLIAELHISLLRICLKSDDEEQTHFSVTDTNHAVNLMIQQLETTTYAEVLRLYIDSYPGVDDSVRDAINTENYPFVCYEPKIVVLLFMCYRFLYSSEYRKIVLNVGKFQNDDACRVCGKSSGTVVSCSQCEASFHQECSNLSPFPEVLVCNICTQNNIRGLSDCKPFDESIDREPLRMKPIGRDRHGRFYWYIARRIFVHNEDDSDMRYYSTPPQLFQLLQSVDADYYEKDLCQFFSDNLEQILEQMTLTVEMSMERRESEIQLINRTTHMNGYVDKVIPEIYLHKDNTLRMAIILRASAVAANLKEEFKVEDSEENEVTPKTQNVLSESLIGIYNGRLINTFWSGGVTEEELVSIYCNGTQEEIVPSEFWRMGDEKNDKEFMQYVNYYAHNDMAESVATRKKIQDKKKHMATKFLIMEDSEFAFNWGKDAVIDGSYSNQLKIMQSVFLKLLKWVSIDLMHRKWVGVCSKYEEDIRNATDYKTLANCLLRFECAVRKPIFVSQWWSGLGQVRFERNTVEQREMFSKEFQKQKKLEADSLAKELDESFVKVNFVKPKYPNTYILRQKGETYRTAGKGAMGGWAWVSCKYTNNYCGVAEKPTLPIAETDSIANIKARKLDKIISEFLVKKEHKASKMLLEQDPSTSFAITNTCYSVDCISEKKKRSQDLRSGNPSLHQCYSINCRSGFLQECQTGKENQLRRKKWVVGEQLAWPIPKVQTFVSNGVKSIFVVDRKIIRQLVKNGGCSLVYIPGFAQNSKSNYIVWNYPAPRPCIDLCWRWLTLNSKSLHAVALQLKVLWACIKWNEFDPDDGHSDRRVVVDLPTHDERRRIVNHKEMGPFGQYERYLLEIEIIPLNEENEEEDDAWSAKKERGGHLNTKNLRRRRNGTQTVRVPKAIRHEWMDGVDLKVFEIKDYWRLSRARATARKKEVAVSQTQLKCIENVPPTTRAVFSSARPAQMNRMSMPVIHRVAPTQSVQRSNGPPPMPVRLQQIQMKQSGARVNHGAQRLRPGAPYSPNGSQIAYSNRPINQKYLEQTGRSVYSNATYSNTPSTSQSRVPGGSEMQISQGRPQLYSPNQPNMRHTSNGYAFQQGLIRGGGVSAQGSRPQMQNVPIMANVKKAVVFQPVGEPQQDMRRVVVQTQPRGLVAEEAVSANASDGDEKPPVIPRYERNTVTSHDPVEPARVVRHVYPNQQLQAAQRRQAGNKAVFVIKRPDGNVVMRAHTAENQVLLQQPSQTQGQQRITFRPTSGTRQMVTSGGARVVRVGNSRVVPGSDIVRRVAVPNNIRLQEYEDGDLMNPQIQYIQQPIQKPRTVVPRGGTTMQMAQQQQSVVSESYEETHEEHPDVNVPYQNEYQK